MNLRPPEIGCDRAIPPQRQPSRASIKQVTASSGKAAASTACQLGGARRRCQSNASTTGISGAQTYLTMNAAAKRRPANHAGWPATRPTPPGRKAGHENSVLAESPSFESEAKSPGIRPHPADRLLVRRAIISDTAQASSAMHITVAKPDRLHPGIRSGTGRKWHRFPAAYYPISWCRAGAPRQARAMRR